MQHSALMNQDNFRRFHEFLNDVDPSSYKICKLKYRGKMWLYQRWFVSCYEWIKK